MKEKTIMFSVLAVLFIGIFLMGCIDIPSVAGETQDIPKFESCGEIKASFAETQTNYRSCRKFEEARNKDINK